MMIIEGKDDAGHPVMLSLSESDERTRAARLSQRSASTTRLRARDAGPGISWPATFSVPRSARN
jgi:hypothetical protein